MREYKSVCLIQPNRAYLVHPSAQAPLGLLYVAGGLLKEGYRVRILDLSESTDIPKVEEEVVGITGTYLDVKEVERLAAFYSASGKRVVVGGPITLSKTLNRSHINLLVHGMGEFAARSIMRDTPERELHEGEIYFLDTLPVPARHLWNGKLGGNIFWKNPCEESATIVSSRGCCFKCAFCCSASMNTQIRFREPKLVVDEMVQIVRERGVKSFRFSDEFFNARVARVAALCSEIRSRAELRGCRWRVSVAANNHERSMFEDMRAAGCEEISLGVESFDERVLEGLNCGKCNSRTILEAAKNAKLSGLVVRALMMCGLPFEDEETLALNTQFMNSYYVDCVAMTVFTPLPGSDIYENPEKYGCALREISDTGLCLYGPNGRNPVEPKILRSDLSLDAHRTLMERMISAAEQTKKVGKG